MVSTQSYMSINPSKTKRMVITTRQKRQNITVKLPALLVEKDPTETVDSHTVLGVVIDTNLTGLGHVNSLFSKKSLEKNASTVLSQTLPEFSCWKSISPC